MGGHLIVIDNNRKAVQRRQVIFLIQIIATDLHFLAGEMIVSQLQLKRRVFGIFGVREAGNDLAQRLQSQPGVFSTPVICS